MARAEADDGYAATDIFCFSEGFLVVLGTREQGPDDCQSRVDTEGMHTNRLPGYLNSGVDLATIQVNPGNSQSRLEWPGSLGKDGESLRNDAWRF